MADPKIRIAVSLSGEDCVDILDYVPEAGRLLRVARLSARSRPGPLVQSRDGSTLYGGLRGSHQLATWTLTGDDGAASDPVQTVRLDSDPCYLALDSRGEWLLAAYYGAGCISVHSTQTDNGLSTLPAWTAATGPKAHCIREIGTTGRLLVPHTGDENAIHEFELDRHTGALKTNGKVAAESDPWIGPAGPRHFEVHPDSSSLFVSNEHSSTVGHWRLNPDGRLGPCLGSVATLPHPWGLANTCAQIRLTNDGRFLYVGNRGHNSLALFAVDQQSGALRRLGWQSTESIPRVFGISSDDRFLFCAGLATGCMTVYEIRPRTGRLAFRNRFAVGTEPMWILPLRAAN